MATALTDTASAYASDNDPEFVRLAAPSTLKMIEMLLDQQPGHQGLLLTACSGFTEYAYAFLQIEAELATPVDASRARDLETRARAMYQRAQSYCWRALDARHRGIKAAVADDPAKAVSVADVDDVPALYWLSACWGGELSMDPNALLRLKDLVAIRVMLGRALQLDESWGAGAIHEGFIALDGLPVLLGGSAARARSHFERAVTISGGQSAFAYVTLASTVSVAAGDRAEFERLLGTALAIDVNRRPELRLGNLVAQKRAKFLLSQVNRLIPPRR
jgi:hypothetical protein